MTTARRVDELARGIRGAAADKVALVVGGAGLALPDGANTDRFLPSLAASAKSAASSGVALFRRTRARYLPRLALNPEVIDRMASAFEIAAAMFQGRAELTRPGLIPLSAMPPGLAGATLAYSTTDYCEPLGGYVGVIRRGVLVAGRSDGHR